MLPEPICLHVYTRHVIPDASVTGLSRDTGPYAQLRREKERRGDTAPGQILRIPWERVFYHFTTEECMTIRSVRRSQSLSPPVSAAPEHSGGGPRPVAAL